MFYEDIVRHAIQAHSPSVEGAFIARSEKRQALVHDKVNFQESAIGGASVTVSVTGRTGYRRSGQSWFRESFNLPSGSTPGMKCIGSSTRGFRALSFLSQRGWLRH